MMEVRGGDDTGEVRWGRAPADECAAEGRARCRRKKGRVEKERGAAAARGGATAASAPPVLDKRSARYAIVVKPATKMNS